MADSLCALWSYIEEKRHCRGCEYFDGGKWFLSLDEDEVESVLATVKASCERLGVPDLWPDDSRMLELAGLPQWFFGGKPKVEGTRLPWIHDRCESLIPQSGEVCPLWEKPFPSRPINTLEAVAEFLTLSKDVWFLGWQGKRDTDSDHNLDRARRDLHNVRMTLTWLHDIGRGPLPPECAAEPDTARDCERLAANLLRWLEAQSETSEQLQDADYSASVADKTRMTIDQRMKLVLFEKPESSGWSVTEFETELKCSRAGIHKTASWKALEAARKLGKAERRNDRRAKTR